MRTALEVADILRAGGPAYRAAQAGHLSLQQLKAMSAIEHCRTAALGGHVEACTDCGHRRSEAGIAGPEGLVAAGASGRMRSDVVAFGQGNAASA